MGVQRISAYASVYLLWGGAYLAVRILVQEFPPFLVAGLRYWLAATCLLPVLLVRRFAAPSRRQMMNAAWTGVLLLAAGYGLVFWAEQQVPSWLAAILVSTSFLWTCAGECFLLRTSRFRMTLLVPLLAGLVGLPLLVDSGGTRAAFSLVASLAVLLSAICWAAGSLAMKRLELPRSPVQTACIQFASSGLVLLSISASFGEWRHAPPLAAFFAVRPLTAMIYLVAGASVAGYLAFLWLIVHDSVSLVTTFTYVNPIVAMLLGILAARERFSPTQLAGAFAVLACVFAFWRLYRPALELAPMELREMPEP
jgi:drug/metabolite transporter (DMT)-like permease